MSKPPRNDRRFAAILILTMCTLLLPGTAQQRAPKFTPPQTDTSFIDERGTAHVTRVVPVPDTIGPEAQKFVAKPMPDAEIPYDLAKDRAQADGWQVNGGEMMRKVYPVNIAAETIAGVPLRIVTPLKIPSDKQNRVLINIHGGGFNADWGSEIESIPIANLTQTKVVAVLYSLAPEHPFPAAVNEIVSVYKVLLKTYKPQNIGLYGTSAGAILTGEVAARLRQLIIALASPPGHDAGPDLPPGPASGFPPPRRSRLVRVGAVGGNLTGHLAPDREHLQVGGRLIDRHDPAEQVQVGERALPPGPPDRLRHLIRGGVAGQHGLMDLREAQVVVGQQFVDPFMDAAGDRAVGRQ